MSCPPKISTGGPPLAAMISYLSGALIPRSPPCAASLVNDSCQSSKLHMPSDSYPQQGIIAYVRVDPDTQQLKLWRKHISLPTHPDQLSPEDLFARAYPYLENIVGGLLSRGWTEMPCPQGVLWAIRPPGSSLPPSPTTPTSPMTLFPPPSSSSSPRRTFSIPSSLNSLLTFKSAWQTIFHDPTLFHATIHPLHGLILDSDPLLADIFYFLQLLLPGCFTLVKEVYDQNAFNTRETRPFPPLAWMEERENLMRGIFGDVYWNVLLRRSRDGNSRLDFLD